uniref:carbonic anhydrase n=1 Tax=Alexandrium catenella TaxID=2925 RepID=A0A7S1KXP7_ALECA
MGLPPRPVVKVSKYMRTIMAEGPFGKLNLKDASGKDVVYEATQVHVTPHSLHTISGSYYDAEMLVMHRPTGEKDLLTGSVIVSVLFRVSNSSSSPVFESLGTHLLKGDEWSVDVFGLADTLNPALQGPAYQYNGSVPVPPCSETVTWMVLGNVQPISHEHLKDLKEVMGYRAGGWHKRGRVPRRLDGGACRKIVKNGLEVSPVHEAATCATLTEDKLPGGQEIRCGNGAHCMMNPRLQADAVMAAPEVDINSLLHYTPQEHVTVVPGKVSLDAVVGHGGNFGHVMLNGRVYVAKKLMIKPISEHTFNGKRYAGELLLQHQVYGAGADAAAHHGAAPDAHAPAPAPAHGSSPSGHAAPGHGAAHGHRRLHAGHGAPEVWVSVPLKLGKESPLLRHLGLGQAAFERAIRDGNSYDLHQAIDLEEELKPALQGSWYWYTASEASHDCGGDHTRWIVFETPLEVSISQINDLSLPVSGMDSTWVSAVAPAHLWKKSLPSHAVEAPAAGHGVCSERWNYKNTHCWAANFSACSGSRQSPINLKASDVQEAGSDNFLNKCSWKPVKDVDVENSGRGLQVVNNQLGYFAYIDEEGNQAYYQVTGVKLHMPSEHMINDKPYDAELQVVHQKQKHVNDLMKDDMAIASFLFRIGDEESPLLKQLHLPGHPVQEDAPTKMALPLDLMRALGPVMDGSYYRYDGSITVPDCSESAKWFVFETPLSMSKAQADAFKTLFPGTGNNRPVQELNGRTVVKNSFMQGTLKQFEFYLNRSGGRSRGFWNRSETLILIPIIFMIVFAIYVMSSLFVREDKGRLREQSGGLSSEQGLEQTIGRAQLPGARF